MQRKPPKALVGSAETLRDRNRVRYDLASDLAIDSPREALGIAQELILEDYFHAYTVQGIAYEQLGEFQAAYISYKNATELVGSVEAWLGIARLALGGRLIGSDSEDAFLIYRDIYTETGDNVSSLMLGILYLSGMGVVRNLEQAECHLRRAEAAGLVVASRELARLYWFQGRYWASINTRAKALSRAISCLVNPNGRYSLRDDSFGRFLSMRLD